MTGLVASAAWHVAYLADDTDVGDETHKAGPIAVVVIIALCVVCFFLFRSMSKHLRRVRDNAAAAVETERAEAAAKAPVPVVETTPLQPTPVETTTPERPALRPGAAPKSRTHSPEE